MGFEVIAISLGTKDSLRVDYPAIRDIVSTYLAPERLEEEWGQFSLPDGSEISCRLQELKAEEPIECLIFRLHGFTELQIDFIWRIARAADLPMVDSGSGKVLYFTRPDQQARLPEGSTSAFTKFVYCASSKEFMRELSEGMKSFMQLKKNLVGEQTPVATGGPGQWVSLPAELPQFERANGK